MVTASTTSAKEGLGGRRGWWVKGARKSGGERGWRVPRQRFCSSTRETETSAVRAGERGVRVKKRERESFSVSRENDSRRTNEKGSTMTAKRAHPPRRFDLSVLESLKRGTRVSFGRDVRITSVYIRIYIYIPTSACNRALFGDLMRAGGASIRSLVSNASISKTR